MDYEQRGTLLKTLCKPCGKKHICKFGCDKWEMEMGKTANEAKDQHIFEVKK